MAMIRERYERYRAGEGRVKAVKSEMALPRDAVVPTGADHASFARSPLMISLGAAVSSNAAISLSIHKERRFNAASSIVVVMGRRNVLTLKRERGAIAQFVTVKQMRNIKFVIAQRTSWVVNIQTLSPLRRNLPYRLGITRCGQ